MLILLQSRLKRKNGSLYFQFDTGIRNGSLGFQIKILSNGSFLFCRLSFGSDSALEIEMEIFASGLEKSKYKFYLLLDLEN
ncbi:hypothetical protein C1645_811043 [Glomus cerebriforme]|uniref:Uncharacterized protein n=1 Tax=Glomus cerebriforme TaxID=658196 RepID=A0A397TQI6_9GLOM|nr:hypothetical protein C1645_811043 [Glomus cerebriforme]